MTDSRPLSGFRLQRIEVRNWGTFDERIWVFDVHGHNALLTGDIGSGKSTLVDALTTILVPAHRVAYNKAAGAESRERTLRSYVLGYFKSTREDDSNAKPVSLRKEASACSVILAHFADLALGEVVTLAQVFWFRDANQPERLYVVANGSLTIKEHFSDFGPEIGGLRKRLRQTPSCESFQTFTDYATAFCRRLGIESEQALDLFHQTVSMKAVGNLTDFVRTHMLEMPHIDAQIDSLLVHFADLDRAHQAVVQAQQQIEQLTPISDQLRTFQDLQVKSQDLNGCSQGLRSWLAQRRLVLIDGQMEHLDTEIRRLRSHVEEASGTGERFAATIKELTLAIGQNGGDRLAQIDAKSALEERELNTKRLARTRFAGRCKEAGLAIPSTVVEFNDLKAACTLQRAGLQSQLQQADNDYTDAVIQVRQCQDNERLKLDELTSLSSRQSNIPSWHIQRRQQLLDELGAAREQDLPFVGEVIRIRPGEEAWQGAIERVLYGFATSLLVSSQRYEVVADWVDRTKMLGRFRYYHAGPTRSRLANLHRKSLIHKIEVRPTVWCRDWVLDQLARTLDYACCDSLQEFRNEEFAVTINGQVKARERHEKDDRGSISDRSRYVLGWSNEEKKSALAKQVEEIREAGRRHLTVLAGAEDERKRLRGRDQALGLLLETQSWTEVDSLPHEQAILTLKQERDALTGGSTTLASLTKRLAEVESEFATHTRNLQDTNRRLTGCETNREAALKAKISTESVRDELTEGEREQWFPRLDDLKEKQPEERELSWDGNDSLEFSWQSRIRNRLAGITNKAMEVRDALIASMQDFRTTWKVLTQELDASIEGAPGFFALLTRLQQDDLPRFKSDFQRALRENTINEIIGFQAKLDLDQQEIKGRIREINRSLHHIDYNPGRFIELMATPDPDAEISDFRRQLRACTENVLGETDEAYSETKFQQVQAIIERLRGREGLTEPDRRWRAKVTDVRNWSEFGASERNRSDGKEHEHYADSGGKSGGQKEKLAYTVLAASIAYRYGLGDDTRRRAFRFVVIDEAFGRGSDDSARFGLELFETLGLQLLIVTPLQKIRVIEPYVSTFGFVTNDGRTSSLCTLTMEEYERKKQGELS